MTVTKIGTSLGLALVVGVAGWGQTPPAPAPATPPAHTIRILDFKKPGVWTHKGEVIYWKDSNGNDLRVIFKSPSPCENDSPPTLRSSCTIAINSSFKQTYDCENSACVDPEIGIGADSGTFGTGEATRTYSRSRRLTAAGPVPISLDCNVSNLPIVSPTSLDAGKDYTTVYKTYGVAWTGYGGWIITKVPTKLCDPSATMLDMSGCTISSKAPSTATYSFSNPACGDAVGTGKLVVKKQ
jgi:hypothetical protein